MVASNLTPSSLSTFFLNGMPGLEAAHIWISILFSVFYISSLLGNFMILYVISKEQTLRKPMYVLLCMLALTDVGLSTSTVPKAVSIFCFSFKDNTVHGCFTQLFFIHAVGAMQSAILVIMAFDRYIAICNPLRYATILTNTRIAVLVFLGLMRAFLLILPMPLFLQRLSFCDNHIIPRMCCDHIAVVKLLCTDTTVSKIYSLAIPLGIIVPDLMLISLSYGLIIRTIIKISSQKVHQKALNTCAAHFCVMLMSYAPFLISVLTQRFGQSIPAHIHILLANLYLLIPPMLNPIIYGVKTKELRDKMGQYICRM